MLDEQEEQTISKVVVDHEEQYSLWPANEANALGWNDTVKAAQRMSAWPTSRKSGPTCIR